MIVEVISGVVALAFAGVAYFAYTIHNEIQKYKHIPGPEGSGGISGFFMGNIASFKEENDKGLWFSEIFFRIFKKYNSRIIKYRLMNKTMVLTNDPKIIKEVLIDQDCPKEPNSYKLMGFPGGTRFLGHGLITETDSKKWSKRRPMFNPAFHKQCLKGFLKAFNDKADVLIEHLKHLSETQKESIKLLDHFNHVALDIIASVAFSIDVDTVRDENNIFNKYIAESLAGCYAYFVDPMMNYKPNKWSYVKEIREKMKSLRHFGRKQIESRLEALRKGEPVPNDILTVILKTMESEGEHEFLLEEMVDDFVTFFVAGQETTSGALASTIYALGQNPEILEKLRKEIDTEIGTKPEIDYEDLLKLKYTKAIFKETLRLYPPSGEPTGRLTHKDINIDDVFIPKGTWILCSMYSSGRCEENFKDPLTYKPERFLKEDENCEPIQNYTFFPFALGHEHALVKTLPRLGLLSNYVIHIQFLRCILLLKIEAKVIIAKFIQNFDFKLDPNQSFELAQMTATRPLEGTKCFLTFRR